MTTSEQAKRERIDIVDENDTVIRTITRAEATNDDITRSACIFIEDPQGRILIQLRSKDSLHYPCYWDCTGGGHVGAGETYAQTAARELREETGIDTPLEYLGKTLIKLSDGRTHWAAFFSGTYDGPVEIDESELEEVRAFTRDELRAMIERGETIHPECTWGLEEYYL